MALAILLLKLKLKKYLGEHHSALLSALMLSLVTGCSFLFWFSIELGLAAKEIHQVSTSILIFSVSLGGMAIGLSHFVHRPAYRRQIWLRSIHATLFSIFIAALATILAIQWLKSGNNSLSQVVLLSMVGAIVGFKDVVHWFMRAFIVRDMTDADLKDIGAFSEEAMYRISVHEAGHALGYGLCMGIPEDAYVCIDPDPQDYLAGAVSLPVTFEPIDFDKELAHWMLLMFVLGMAAEEVVFESGSMSGIGDLEAFNNLAVLYLGAGHGEVYEPSPQNELDVSANRAALQRLRERYKQLAREYIIENKATLLQLAGALQGKEFLDCEDLSARLVNIRTPPDWTLLRWPKSLPIFSPKTIYGSASANNSTANPS